MELDNATRMKKLNLNAKGLWVVRDVAMETISALPDQHSMSHPYVASVIYLPTPSQPHHPAIPYPWKPMILDIV